MTSAIQKQICIAAILALCLTAAGCANLQSPLANANRLSLDRCNPSASSLNSRAGREWNDEYGWRFADRETAARAYRILAEGASPWPDWFEPHEEILPAGTRLQMALSPRQSAQEPGAFATFERIKSVRNVRNYLAVRSDWKPAVDRVAVYEVTQPLPVKIGPIGPQIDPLSCRLLVGRWSQVEMKVAREERARYLKIIEVHAIH